jgi:hypothetical protein
MERPLSRQEQREQLKVDPSCEQARAALKARLISKLLASLKTPLKPGTY